MEDIQMINNINNQFEEPYPAMDPDKKEKEDDSSTTLNNIQKELRQLNQTFADSLFYIKQFSGFKAEGTEKNMEKEEHGFKNLPDYEENRKNFDNKLSSFGDEINNYFDKVLEMTKKLRQFEEFNMTEKELEQKLNDLKKKNKEANEAMNEKLKKIEKINEDLKMENEANIRDYMDENLDM